MQRWEYKHVTIPLGIPAKSGSGQEIRDTQAAIDRIVRETLRLLGQKGWELSTPADCQWASRSTQVKLRRRFFHPICESVTVCMRRPAP